MRCAPGVLVLLLFASSSEGALVEYRGWKDCIKLSNGTAQIVIIPAVGGRVSFSGTRVILSSKLNPELKLAMTKSFELHKAQPVVKVTYTLSNHSSETQRWCFWERTLVSAPGVAILPLNPRSKFARGWKSTKQTPPGIISSPKNLLLVRPSTIDTFIITDSTAGWIAYLKEPFVFVISFPYEGEGSYVHNGTTCAIYTAADRVELEPVSPQFVLKAGESKSFSESWLIFETEASRPERVVEEIESRFSKEMTPPKR